MSAEAEPSEPTRPSAEGEPPREPGPHRRDGGAVPRTPAWLERAIDRLSVGEGTFDRPPPSDVLLAGLLMLPAVAVYAFQPSVGVDRTSFAGLAGWVLLVVAFGSLAWRRVVPPVTMITAGLATGAWFLIGHSDGFIPLAVMVALYSVAAYGSRADGISSLVITEIFVAASFVAVSAGDGQISLIQLPVNLLMFLGIWVLGDRTRVRRELVEHLRAQAEQAERSRELATELAVSDERSRISRELHDVVAHTVSVMVVQAGAGRRVAATDPARASAVLAAIEEVGRDALADLRRMVGVLRDDPEPGQLAPQPRLEDLTELCDRLATAGLPVRMEFVGEVRPVASAVEVSAYRITQEALTNVMKHAGTVLEVVVTIRYGEGAIVVEVDDDGRGAAGSEGDGHHGSGLVGMRERVAVFDGTLHAGPRPGGGYRVRAVLPIPPDGGERERSRAVDGQAAVADRSEEVS